jgi:hypothetical protein
MQRSGRLKSLLAIALLLLGTARPILAQQGNSGQSIGKGSTGSLPPALPPIAPELDAPSPDMEANQERMRNRDRQKQLVLDTEKLLALANELKVDVDKSTKDTMSLDVIRKADEIEKLAHNVKEKMKGE